jgi:hypothetical protein
MGRPPTKAQLAAAATDILTLPVRVKTSRAERRLLDRLTARVPIDSVWSSGRADGSPRWRVVQRLPNGLDFELENVLTLEHCTLPGRFITMRMDLVESPRPVTRELGVLRPNFTAKELLTIREESAKVIKFPRARKV